MTDQIGSLLAEGEPFGIIYWKILIYSLTSRMRHWNVTFLTHFSQNGQVEKVPVLYIDLTKGPVQK